MDPQGEITALYHQVLAPSEYVAHDLTLQPLFSDGSVPAHAADTFPDERSQLSCGEMKGRAFHELE